MSNVHPVAPVVPAQSVAPVGGVAPVNAVSPVAPVVAGAQPVAAPLPVVGTVEPVEAAAAAVALNSNEPYNVRFKIEGTRVAFYQTTQPFNNQDTFETFALARAAAVQAFSQHKHDVLVALETTGKELVTLPETSVIAYNPEGGW